jgi:hypothetical protein
MSEDVFVDPSEETLQNVFAEVTSAMPHGGVAVMTMFVKTGGWSPEDVRELHAFIVEHFRAVKVASVVTR